MVVWKTKEFIKVGQATINSKIPQRSCHYVGDENGTQNQNMNSKTPQWSFHYVGVPMFWPDWQNQKIRQHQTALGFKDLALLNPERDLSMNELKDVIFKT